MYLSEETQALGAPRRKANNRGGNHKAVAVPGRYNRGDCAGARACRIDADGGPGLCRLRYPGRGAGGLQPGPKRPERLGPKRQRRGVRELAEGNATTAAPARKRRSKSTDVVGRHPALELGHSGASSPKARMS
jgi:hypothetical protein